MHGPRGTRRGVDLRMFGFRSKQNSSRRISGCVRTSANECVGHGISVEQLAEQLSVDADGDDRGDGPHGGDAGGGGERGGGDADDGDSDARGDRGA